MELPQYRKYINFFEDFHIGFHQIWPHLPWIDLFLVVTQKLTSPGQELQELETEREAAMRQLRFPLVRMGKQWERYMHVYNIYNMINIYNMSSIYQGNLKTS